MPTEGVVLEEVTISMEHSTGETHISYKDVVLTHSQKEFLLNLDKISIRVLELISYRNTIAIKFVNDEISTVRYKQIIQSTDTLLNWWINHFKLVKYTTNKKCLLKT